MSKTVEKIAAEKFVDDNIRKLGKHCEFIVVIDGHQFVILPPVIEILF